MKKAFLLVLLIFINCNSKELTTYEKMESDKLMSEFFTNSELKDLAKIVDFFESEVFKTSKKYRAIDYNYLLKNDSTIIFSKEGGFQELIDYEKQKELYKILNKTFLESFWVERKIRQNDSKNEKIIECKYFHLRFFDESGYSKYSKFLKKVSKLNKIIENYYEGIKLMNDFGEPGSILLVHNHNHLNKEDIKIRLIYAFFYLNINEEIIKTNKCFNEIINVHS